MKMTVKGVSAELARIQRALRKEHEKQFGKELVALASDLVAATPVDTGFARESWSIVNNGIEGTIVNNAEYIDELNRGHSKQAPPFFIERVALSHGKPVGTIVTVKE